MKNSLIYLVIFLLLQAGRLSYAFDWPVKEQRVGSTFGQSVAGNFNTGISLIGSDEAVFPIAEGEIIYSYEENRNYTSLPRGLGSYLILYHKGEIQSVYGHLKKQSMTTVPGYMVSRDTQIAVVGNTGASVGGSLFIQIYDIEENLILNPLKEFSPGLSDKDKPVIEKILVKRADSSIELVNNSKVEPGEVNILIQAEDTWKENTRYIRKFTPYKISMNQDGVESLNLTFDAIREKEHNLVLAGSGKTYADIYEDPGLINLGKINLVEGIARFQFLVIDYARDAEKAGNQVVSDYTITVAAQQ